MIAVAVVGAIVLIAVGGGGGGSDSKAASSAKLTKLQDQLLVRSIVDSKAGIAVRKPKNWAVTRGANLISLRSPDRCVGMTFYGAETTKAQRVLGDSLAVLKRQLKGPSIQAEGRAQVGGIPTTSARLTGRGNGKQVRVVLSIGKGKHHTYVTQTTLSGTSCQGALQRAQLILSSLQYTK